MILDDDGIGFFLITNHYSYSLIGCFISYDIAIIIRYWIFLNLCHLE